MSKLYTFENMLIHEIKAIYSADAQMTKALPRMIQLAANNSLRRCFEEKSRQMRDRPMRLEQAMEQLGSAPRDKTCRAMKAYMSEIDEIARDRETSPIRDAQLVVLAQKMTHHSISTYRAAETLAYVLGNDSVAKILWKILQEENEHQSQLFDMAVMLYTETDADNQYTPMPILASDRKYCYAN